MLHHSGNKTENWILCVCVFLSDRVCGRGSQVFWEEFEYISIFKRDRYAWIFLNWEPAQQPLSR